MKPKLLFSLLLSLSSIVSSAQVIFDPATYPQDSLPAGMTLDTIDGRVYVQIILNGWSSYIKINPQIAINEKSTHFRTMAKLSAGVSGFELSQIKTFLKLVNPDYSELAAAANNSSDSLIHYQVKLVKIDQVGYIQVAGQETVGWTAVTGDTLWLGKVMAVEVDPQAIFDPDAYDPDLLPEGMSLVKMDGVTYCQVILNGSESYLETLPFSLDGDFTHIRSKVKYGSGVSGYELAKIGIQVAAFTSDWTELAAIGNPMAAKSDLTIYKAPIHTEGTVGYLQFSAVEKTGWNMIIGDTLWIGKVRAVTVESGVVFDPAQYDPDELPDGMEIVSIGNNKYLKAILNSWSSYIPLDPVNASASYTHFSADVKYAVGSSGFELSNINTFLKLATADWTELAASGSASSSEFKKYSVPIPTQGLAANFQFAGQEKTNWSAVTGDTLWIGKTIFEDKAAPTAPDNLTATVEGSTVTLTWDKSTDNARVSGYVISQNETVLDTVTAKTFEVTGLADGTYTFSVVAMDASGNYSTASMADATVGLTAIHSPGNVKIKIYPNPVTSILQVNRVQDILEMRIIAITGTIVRTVHNTNTVDVADLREGLYLIQVKTPSGVYTATFIKD